MFYDGNGKRCKGQFYFVSRDQSDYINNRVLVKGQKTFSNYFWHLESHSSVYTIYLNNEKHTFSLSQLSVRFECL